MVEVIASNNPNNEWGKSVIEITLKQWAYSADFTVHVGGNCRGYSVFDAAIYTLFEELLEAAGDGTVPAKVTLTNPAGDTLICEDEEGHDEDWLKDMIVAIRLVDYLQPTLNEVRKRNGAPPVPHGDAPYVPLGDAR